MSTWNKTHTEEKKIVQFFTVMQWYTNIGIITLTSWGLSTLLLPCVKKGCAKGGYFEVWGKQQALVLSGIFSEYHEISRSWNEGQTCLSLKRAMTTTLSNGSILGGNAEYSEVNLLVTVLLYVVSCFYPVTIGDMFSYVFLSVKVID